MPQGRVSFDDEKCKGCMLCVSFCPTKILSLDRKRINEKGYHLISVSDMNKCVGCSMCAVMCPDSVITVERLKGNKNE